MEKIILHIGMPKAGSTSIQEFLKINTKELLDRNYFIPNFYGSGVNSWPLTFPFMNKNKFNNKKRRLYHLDLSIEITQENLLNYYEEKFQNFKEKYSKKILLTSSEDFFGELKTSCEIKSFQSFINKFFDSVEIILYIRNPLSKAISCLSENVKQGRLKNELNKSDIPLYSYKKYLTHWLECFPGAKFQLALFQEEDLYRKNLIIDFNQRIGLVSKAKSFDYKVENTSLNYKAICVLAEINKRLSTIENNMRSNKILINLLETIYLNQPKYYVSDNLCNAFKDFFSEDDEWLRSKFFQNKQYLWDYKKYSRNEKNNYILDKYDQSLINNIICRSDMYFKSK